MIRPIVLAFAASMLAVAAALPATAADEPAYVGTWGAKGQCKNAQESTDAPMIVTKDGYDQHEAHCKFTEVTQKNAKTWNVKATCTVEGAEQPEAMTLKVSGKKLTITGEGGSAASRVLRRCK